MPLEETKARILAASETAEGLLAQVNDLYVEEIRSEERILKDALSELHNSGEIDLVEIIRSVDKSSCGHNFFTILHAFEDVLPSLNASVEDVLRCLVHLTQQSGRDLAGAFERFCSMEVNRPRDSVGFILAQSELGTYAPFLSSSILTYDSNCVTEAIQMTEKLISHKNEVVRTQAYFTLGMLDVGEAHANTIWDLFNICICSERESGCCAAILRSILHFGQTFPSYWLQIEELMPTFVEGAPPEVLHEISNIIAFQRIDLPDGILGYLVKQLTNVSPEHNGTISNINCILVNLIKSESFLSAVELLESLLAIGVKITDLGDFSNELLSQRRDLLNHIITRWFLSGESLLCHGVLDLLNDVTGKDIELKAEIALLDDGVKQVFVSYKAVGWLFTRPIAAASFILSIYERASRTTRIELDKVLYDPLLLSYPGELKRFFQSCIDKGFQVRPCERLLGKLQAYHSDIDKISGLKELMAPKENISVYWKASNKSMQAAYEDASRGSIIDLIATKHALLYGNSSIFYVHQGGRGQVRQEMQMQSFSQSTEMPRLNVFDPVSLDYILRMYRFERLKNEADS
ncbi:aspartyl/asparaginyl beta-hydroxylase domain-containing protein [Shewanella psychromarinicola]|uniref:Uncharacterized protein n=1 Tax=Shewanella psychromarinicola TaxID=2487742 RepID=A0A3N4DUF9_9GAMM|nr:aspartyl/asparaginyl beta-hydroxylase domain-containing protein [Shewanella psychromarinicola]AZG34597.1 hypothetical protein EGC80_06440 [Shewanella psychromarinicola]MCL1084382.1 aspartyl/asparaginyl beta-hydroxylase domain-containing protein [Shewanella psychromarinicola]RPA28172.1 hypothetical protein EGC77_15770 [Shewanella psychromarinicola]